MKHTLKFPLLLLLLAGMIGSTGCVRELLCIDGHGPVETRTLSLPTITGISLEEAARVSIHQGDVQQVTVRGHQNILDRLRERVDNGLWEIELGNACFYDLDLQIDITVKDLRKVILAGSGDIIIDDFKDQGNLDLLISGSGYIRLGEFTGTEKLDVIISGSGDVNANADFPDLEELDITISGSGDFEGYLLETARCDATITGSGDIYTRVADHLNVIISGSGDVHYKGFPTIDVTITGSGRVINEN